MEIIYISPYNRDQIRQFIHLPFHLYSSVPQWVPPFRNDALRVFDHNRNPFYIHSNATFYLAKEADRVIGRLAILDNSHYNEHNNQRSGFFYLFECEENEEAAKMLFSAGFSWARDRGLDKIIGPRGFTVFDGIGLLVKGFQHRPAFGLPYNLPYYEQLLKGVGFEPAHDLVSGYLDEKIDFPERFHQIASRIIERRGYQIMRFRSRRELRRFLPELKDLYNNSLAGTVGNIPLTDEEVKSLANQMLWFADHQLLKIIMKDEKAIGFLFAYPDISAALQRTRGKFLPFGWLDMWLELKRTKWININGAGMIEGYRGLGGTALLFSEMYKSVAESDRYRFADIVQIGTENVNMQREMRELGIDFYKMHRVYEKIL